MEDEKNKTFHPSQMSPEDIKSIEGAEYGIPADTLKDMPDEIYIPVHNDVRHYYVIGEVSDDIIKGRIKYTRAPSEKPAGDRVAALELLQDRLKVVFRELGARGANATEIGCWQHDIARYIYTLTHPAPVTEEK